MRSVIHLQDFWRSRSGEALALCTIIRKEYSGCRAVGAKKIVARAGDACGLLSGDGLEGDIDRTARENWDAMPFVRSFGDQAAGPGAVDILFERLPDSLRDMELYLPFGIQPKASGVAVSLNDGMLGHRAFSAKADNDNLFFDPWIQPISLYVIGRGAECQSFAGLVAPLGWHLRLLDYREDTSGFPVPSEIFPLDQIGAQIAEGPRTAIMVMTHDEEADQAIFAQLSKLKVSYIGCQGPHERYEKIRQELATRGVPLDAEWEKCVHAPAGLLATACEPEEIALSIVAQVQSALGPS